MENPYWLSHAHCLMFYLYFFLRSKYILANKLIIQRCKLGCRAVSILSCEMCWQFAQSKQYQFHLDDEGQANCLLLNRVAGDKFPEKCFSNWLIKHTSYFHIVIFFFFLSMVFHHYRELKIEFFIIQSKSPNKVAANIAITAKSDTVYLQIEWWFLNSSTSSLVNSIWTCEEEEEEEMILFVDF